MTASDETLRALTVEFGRCLAAGIDTSGTAATLKRSLERGTLNETQALAALSGLLRRH